MCRRSLCSCKHVVVVVDDDCDGGDDDDVSVFRLDYQVATLEKESEAKQESMDKADVRLSGLLAKLDAAPRKELMDKYVSDVQRLSEELREARDMLNE